MYLVKNESADRPKMQVGGVAGCLLAWAKTWNLDGGMRRRPRRRMQLGEALAIGGKKQLMLVSCEGERFLVGTGADSVQSIVRVRPEQATVKATNLRGMGDPL